jgi:hypothetical protein
MIDNEFENLSVTIHMAHPDAVRLRDRIAKSSDGDWDQWLLEVIRIAITDAENEQRRRDRTAPRK